MAIVNIPFGGQTVGIEIPDFALEATQRDIFDLSRDQLTTLQSIEAEISGQTNVLQRLSARSARDSRSPGDDRLSNDIRNNTNETRRGSQKLLDGFKAFQGAFEEQKASEMASSLLSAAGFGQAAAIAGTVLGVLEKFGEALSKTSRVGVGLGENLATLRNETAQIGVTFDQFAAIIATNGELLRTLGRNTGEGALAAIELTRSFRNATRAQGFFGMANDEMMQLLLEEADIRRQTIGQLALDNLGLDGLASSVAENIAQQTALSRITGQDVRDRLAQRRAALTDPVVQSYLREITNDASRQQEAEKIGAVTANLSNIPGIGPELAQAVIASIATGIDFRAINEDLVLLSGPAVELAEYAISAARNTGVSIEDFNAQLLSMTGSMESAIDPGLAANLRARTVLGEESLARFLQTQTQTRQLGSLEEIQAEYDRAYTAIMEGGALAGAGISAAAGEVASEMNNFATQIAVGLVGGDPNSAGGQVVNALTGLASGIRLGTSGIITAFDAIRDYVDSAGILGVLPETELGVTTGEMNADPTGGAGDATVDGGARDDDLSQTQAQPISFTPDDFRNAVIQAFMELTSNGGLPVNVRNTRDFPTPTFTSSA